MTQNHIDSWEPLATVVQFRSPVLGSSDDSPLAEVRASGCRGGRGKLLPSFLSYRRIISNRTRECVSVSVNGGDEIPFFVPPSNNKPVAPAVSDCMTLVLSVKRPPPEVVLFTVSLHVYELSHGVLGRHSKEMTGAQIPGIYHSAIVCYGMEFFFEGGIAITSPGRTRFGKTYEKIYLGTTSKTLSEFRMWIKQQEKESYYVSAYHPTQHNCHHFSKNAVTFLLGCNRDVPAYLINTVDDLIKTKVGAAVEVLMLRFIRGLQYGISKAQWKRMIDRRQSAMLITQCSRACEIGSEPPICVVLFRVDDIMKGRKLFDAVKPYVMQLVERKVIKKSVMTTLNSAFIITEGVESIDPSVVTEFVDIISQTLMYTHRTLWGPVLNCLRIVILHKVALNACVFHPQLLGILASGARDFLSMTADGKLALLRVLCNLSSGEDGAIALNSPNFSDIWVSAVGMALMDHRNTAIVYTGAALAVNLAHAFVLTTFPALSKCFSSRLFSHSANRLITILLFFLFHWPQRRLSEAAKNMLLLTLFFIAFSSIQTMRIVKMHPFRGNFANHLREVRTNESKALLCFLHGIDLLTQ